MAWDDDKSTASDPNNPSADEQLTDDEWGAHVTDQKNHSGRHEDGGTDEISVAGLSGVLADPQDPNLEQVRDAVASFITAGTEISVTHDDPNDTLTIDFSGSHYTAEQARDDVGAALVGGTDISVTVDDSNDTITIDYTGGGTVDVSDGGVVVAAGVGTIDAGTDLEAVNNGDGSATFNVTGGSGGTATPRKMTMYTPTQAGTTGGNEYTMVEHTGEGIVYGHHMRGFIGQMSERFYIDGEGTASYQLGGSDAISVGSDGDYREYIGVSSTSNAGSVDYYYMPNTPIRYETGFEFAAYRANGSSGDTRAFILALDDYSDTYGSVGTLYPRADGENGTSVGSGSTTTLIDTGAGAKGKFCSFGVELEGAGGGDFDVDVFVDGEATASVSLNYQTAYALWGDTANTGHSLWGVGSNTGPYGMYFNPESFGWNTWFSDRLEVAVTNNEASGGNADWWVSWAEE